MFGRDYVKTEKLKIPQFFTEPPKLILNSDNLVCQTDGFPTPEIANFGVVDDAGILHNLVPKHQKILDLKSENLRMFLEKLRKPVGEAANLLTFACQSRQKLFPNQKFQQTQISLAVPGFDFEIFELLENFTYHIPEYLKTYSLTCQTEIEFLGKFSGLKPKFTWSFSDLKNFEKFSTFQNSETEKYPTIASHKNKTTITSRLTLDIPRMLNFSQSRQHDFNCNYSKETFSPWSQVKMNQFTKNIRLMIDTRPRRQNLKIISNVKNRDPILLGRHYRFECREVVAQNLAASQNLTFLDQFSAFPQPKFFWYKLVNNEQSILTVSDSNLLEFHSIEYQNSGKYFCRAENYVGSAEIGLNIAVEHPPKDVYIKRVDQGSFTNLICTCYDAVPMVHLYHWKFNSSSHKKGGWEDYISLKKSEKLWETLSRNVKKDDFLNYNRHAKNISVLDSFTSQMDAIYRNGSQTSAYANRHSILHTKAIVVDRQKLTGIVNIYCKAMNVHGISLSSAIQLGPLKLSVFALIPITQGGMLLGMLLFIGFVVGYFVPLRRKKNLGKLTYEDIGFKHNSISTLWRHAGISVSNSSKSEDENSASTILQPTKSYTQIPTLKKSAEKILSLVSSISSMSSNMADEWINNTSSMWKCEEPTETEKIREKNEWISKNFSHNYSLEKISESADGSLYSSSKRDEISNNSGNAVCGSKMVKNNSSIFQTLQMAALPCALTRQPSKVRFDAREDTSLRKEISMTKTETMDTSISDFDKGVNDQLEPCVSLV